MTIPSDPLFLCSIDDVAPGQVLKAETDGLTLAIFNVAGEYFVTDDLCTHGPGSLSEGFVIDDMVECDFHNGTFNIKTGEVLSAPCTDNLKIYPVTIMAHQVTIPKPIISDRITIPIRPIS